VSQEQYIWELAKFRDRLMVMRDLLQTYEEEGVVPDEENPFMDKQEPLLIGKAEYVLEGLTYLIDNPVETVLIAPNYSNHGSLSVNIIPVTPEGEELPEDMEVECPEELLDQRLDFVVHIEKIMNLPSDFCKDVYVEY